MAVIRKGDGYERSTWLLMYLSHSLSSGGTFDYCDRFLANISFIFFFFSKNENRLFRDGRWLVNIRKQLMNSRFADLLTVGHCRVYTWWTNWTRKLFADLLEKSVFFLKTKMIDVKKLILWCTHSGQEFSSFSWLGKKSGDLLCWRLYFFGTWRTGAASQSSGGDVGSFETSYDTAAAAQPTWKAINTHTMSTKWEKLGRYALLLWIKLKDISTVFFKFPVKSSRLFLLFMIWTATMSIFTTIFPFYF